MRGSWTPQAAGRSKREDILSAGEDSDVWRDLGEEEVNADVPVDLRCVCDRNARVRWSPAR